MILNVNLRRKKKYLEHTSVFIFMKIYTFSIIPELHFQYATCIIPEMLFWK